MKPSKGSDDKDEEHEDEEDEDEEDEDEDEFGSGDEKILTKSGESPDVKTK